MKKRAKIILSAFIAIVVVALCVGLFFIGQEKGYTVAQSDFAPDNADNLNGRYTSVTPDWREREEWAMSYAEEYDLSAAYGNLTVNINAIAATKDQTQIWFDVDGASDDWCECFKACHIKYNGEYLKSALMIVGVSNGVYGYNTMAPGVPEDLNGAQLEFNIGDYGTVVFDDVDISLSHSTYYELNGVEFAVPYAECVVSGAEYNAHGVTLLFDWTLADNYIEQVRKQNLSFKLMLKVSFGEYHYFTFFPIPLNLSSSDKQVSERFLIMYPIQQEENIVLDLYLRGVHDYAYYLDTLATISCL